ncbi:cell division protein DamX [Pseudoalteromonas aliena]|uniref:Cell division protein DamX n=1 Tax=Pseudoalteromonas aliena TaxID=247523 RepID=A0A1Q2GWS4_9GAMM|nr:AAA family ATPase [Pseudoalteromonas aliena]AQP99470.1 cell division protein DamX [Pseudoalteromonas aliena]
MQLQILPSRAALVDRIALQFEYGQNLIVLLGTSGLGKSYMLETFITDKYTEFNKVFVQTSAKMTDTQLMSSLLEQSFKTPLVDHNLTLSENFFQLSQQQSCGPCLWVLDGGRNLSEEFLSELELLAKNSPSTLYIMLASSSKLPLNNAVEIYLEPLTLSESKQLMGWYFKDLPYDEDPVFQAFLTEAHGNPSLLLAWQANEHVANVVVKDKVSWRLHLLILMLIIMFLIIGFLYKSDMTQWWQQYYQQEQVEVSTTAISVKRITESSLEKDNLKSAFSTPNSSTLSAGEVIAEPSIAERKPLHNDVPAIMQSLTKPKENVDVVASNDRESTPVIEQPAKVSKEIANKTSQPEREKQWYLKQPEANIVIQLLAVTQQQVSVQFIAQYKLQNTVHIYQTKRNNKVWWVITYGSFENLSDATLAMKNLPIGILKNKPFYKRINKIKQEIALLDQ